VRSCGAHGLFRLAESDQAFNAVIRGVHAIAERANTLLKVTFKALRRVSLGTSSITRIARAAVVLLQLEMTALPERRSQNVTRRYRERFTLKLFMVGSTKRRWRETPAPYSP
jgi:hypothetical protein